MIQMQFRFDRDRISKRFRRKKTRENVFTASLCIFAGILFLCVMGHNAKIFHGSGILTVSGIPNRMNGLATGTKIMIDQQYYIIEVNFSEKKLRDLLPELENIEGSLVDFHYWKARPQPAVILELECEGREIISFEPSYSNLMEDQRRFWITSYLLITGGLIFILRELRILRIYRKRSGRNGTNQS